MRVRTFVFIALLGAGAVSAFAQQPFTVQVEKDRFFGLSERLPFEISIDGANDEAIQTVKSALNLSDVQVNALKALLTQRSQNVSHIEQSMAEAQSKLEDLLSQTSPNPTEVGAALLASRG